MARVTSLTAPTWDLSDIFHGIDDARLQTLLAQLPDKAQAFATQYKTSLSSASPESFHLALQAYEGLEEDVGKVVSYAQLRHAAAVNDAAIGQFYQACQEMAAAVAQRLVFFTLTIATVDAATYQTWYDYPPLCRYRHWLATIRRQGKHFLSEELEQFSVEKDLTASAAWGRLYDETMARLRFPFEGESLTEAEILTILGHDTDASRRKQAALSFSSVLEANKELFVHITNTLAKDKAIEDSWRKYSYPAASRHQANQIEPEVVDALVQAVQDAYPRLTHRYYALKAKWFGKAQLEYWDRNAPLPDGVTPKRYTFDEAKDIVLQAFADFSPSLAAIGQKFFDHHWIDAQAREGKDSGAFAHPVVPSVHPYLLMNFHGTARDVMTLAHELGHGVHQYLAREQGVLLADTPLTIAETASVFGEMLTFQRLLGQVSRAERKHLLAGKVEDMLNTVVRQIAFHQFETEVHNQRAQGELSLEMLNELWMRSQASSLGASVNLHASYQYYWMYIPHFIHTPFYVYAYAFGDCLVNALYRVYQAGLGGFSEKYSALLAAGGSQSYSDLLQPFGVNPSDPAFWQQGLDVIAHYIDECEKLS